MLLIADSGSTKTEWRLINEEGETVSITHTQGLNPYFLPKEKIALIVKEKVVPVVGHIEKIFFYGAGCGASAKAAQVKEAIEEAIPFKSSCEVAGDILGTARSVLQREKGIACILGTGANSCVYNGQEIIENIPSLGYMLSDWGSGTVMGKDFLSLVLQEKLPESIVSGFYETYGMTRFQILDSIYNKPLPNRFLASFTPFLLKNAEEPECRTIILNNFRCFFDYYVLRYSLVKSSINVSFTGSVAYKFRKYLSEVAVSKGIMIDKIVQHPMEGLTKFHSIKVPIL